MAPVIGGFLTDHFSWRAIFLVQGSVAAIMLLATSAGFAESLRESDPLAIQPRRLFTNYATFFSNPRCLGFALVSASVFGGLFAVLSASPFVLIDLYGMSSQAYGFFFGASVLGYMVGAFWNRRLLHRGVASEALLRRGLVVLAAAAGAMLLLPSTRWGGIAGIMVPYVTYCFAISFVQANAVAAAMEPVAAYGGHRRLADGRIQMSSGALRRLSSSIYSSMAPDADGHRHEPARRAPSPVYVLIARRQRFADPQIFGRIVGKAMTSRIDGLLVKSITSRSMPMPSPPAGGMPYSSASTKSASRCCASSSPFSRSFICAGTGPTDPADR